jgi:DNA-binding transcriptional ArsR family regulator
MKRDIDLIRKILFEIEKYPYYNGEAISLNIENYSPEEINYHVNLLEEAGLVQVMRYVSNMTEAYATRLTWQGHEFLDAARDDTHWAKARAIMSQAGGFVFEVGKAILIDIAKTSASNALANWH